MDFNITHYTLSIQGPWKQRDRKRKREKKKKKKTKPLLKPKPKQTKVYMNRMPRAGQLRRGGGKAGVSKCLWVFLSQHILYNNETGGWGLTLKDVLISFYLNLDIVSPSVGPRTGKCRLEKKPEDQPVTEVHDCIISIPRPLPARPLPAPSPPLPRPLTLSKQLFPEFEQPKQL